MAWQVSKRVWGSIKTEGDKKKAIDASERLILLALADKADEQGICWPKYDTSYQTLGDMVGVNRRSAMRLVEGLCEAGHLWKSETAGRGHSNTFIVTIGLTQEEIRAKIALIGVTDDTINESKKVLPETPKQKEMVLPVTLNGVTDDTNKGLNGVTGNTQSNKSPSKTNRLSNDNGAKAPKDKAGKKQNGEPGPRQKLMDEFLAYSGLRLPHRRSDERFWWGGIGELYELFDRDVDIGKKMIRQVIDELRRDKMRITGPESLVKTARDLVAQKIHKPKMRLE